MTCSRTGRFAQLYHCRTLLLLSVAFLLGTVSAFGQGAQVGISIVPNQDLTGSQFVGETAKTGDVRIANPLSTGAVDILSVNLQPACTVIPAANTPCPGGSEEPADSVLDVTEGVGAGTGAGGCVGTTWDITGPNANGSYDFTVQGATVSVPLGGNCFIEFAYDVIANPSLDASASPGTQTIPVASVGVQITGGALTGGGTGTTETTFETCAVTFDKQISCEGGADGTFVDVDKLDSIEGCISTGGTIVTKFVATNTGTAPAFCSISDELDGNPLSVPTGADSFELAATGENMSMTFTTDNGGTECSPDSSGVNTGQLDCFCGDQAVVLPPITDSAEHGCCAIQIDKQVSCADGPFSDVAFADGEVDGCISWNAYGEIPAEGIDIQYKTDMTGISSNVGLNDCVLKDTNPYVLDSPTEVMPAVGIQVGDASSLNSSEPWLSSDCSDTNLKLGEVSNQNTATLACDCALTTPDTTAAEVQVSDMDTAGFQCQTPGLMISKTCEVPDGENAEIEVTVTNTSPDGAMLDGCVVTDELASNDLCDGPFTDVGLTDNDPIIVDPTNFSLLAGDDQVFDGTTAVTSSVCNTASVTCDIAGTDKQITSETDTLCEANPPGCLTRTIGFHSNRSAFVDAIGTINVCGQSLTGFDDVSGLLCRRGQDILQAQCAAAALNVAASLEGEGTCIPTSTSPAGPLLAVCCGAGENGDVCSGDSIDGCIAAVTDFNESDDSLDCFELAPGVDYCNPGRNGPDSCNGTKGPKGPKNK